ncbi:hypothetical protein LOTGIDRAFT_237681 [Lottia gigantea]|uniref:C2H2-type domain-containing protein n=1 Tax=Lottia gigantea TaxID=225164 RepID=V4AH71_LOTGI|nr:hypothetical protein LOTGIDRAFT_237681 [Lottia gigantea]ESP03364.1 hypothetical protein LOTGIDRAFT_237681 [Lottia gigantea]
MASYCDICSVQLNCMKQFSQHTEGKAHKKKLAQLVGSVSKPKIEFVPEGQLQSVDPNKVEDQSYQSGSLKFNIQPQTRISEDWSQVKFCYLCNKALNSAHQAEQHFSSVKHLKRTAQSNIEESGARGTKRRIVKTDYEDDIRQNGPGDGLGFDIDPELDHTITLNRLTSEGQEKKSKMDDTFCYLCNKTFTSPHVAEVHYNSIKHLKRTQANHTVDPEVVPKNNSSNGNCVPIEPPPDPSATPLPVNYLDNKSWENPVTDPPNSYQRFREQKPFLNNQPATAGHFFCTFCNLGLNSQTQIDAHRAGARHKKNVTKAKGQQGAITSTTSS